MKTLPSPGPLVLLLGGSGWLEVPVEGLYQLRYFEDCEGQVLDASLTGPDGTVVPISEWRLYR